MKYKWLAIYVFVWRTLDCIMTFVGMCKFGDDAELNKQLLGLIWRYGWAAECVVDRKVCNRLHREKGEPVPNRMEIPLFLLLSGITIVKHMCNPLIVLSPLMLAYYTMKTRIGRK